MASAKAFTRRLRFTRTRGSRTAVWVAASPEQNSKLLAGDFQGDLLFNLHSFRFYPSREEMQGRYLSSALLL